MFPPWMSQLGIGRDPSVRSALGMNASSVGGAFPIGAEGFGPRQIDAVIPRPEGERSGFGARLPTFGMEVDPGVQSDARRAAALEMGLALLGGAFSGNLGQGFAQATSGVRTYHGMLADAHQRQRADELQDARLETEAMRQAGLEAKDRQRLEEISRQEAAINALIDAEKTGEAESLAPMIGSSQFWTSYSSLIRARKRAGPAGRAVRGEEGAYWNIEDGEATPITTPGGEQLRGYDRPPPPRSPTGESAQDKRFWTQHNHHLKLLQQERAAIAKELRDLVRRAGPGTGSVERVDAGFRQAEILRERLGEMTPQWINEEAGRRAAADVGRAPSRAIEEEGAAVGSSRGQEPSPAAGGGEEVTLETIRAAIGDAGYNQLLPQIQALRQGGLEFSDILRMLVEAMREAAMQGAGSYGQ